MDLNINDRHIIITGGAGSLGSTVTRLLIEEGASCSVPCFNTEEQENFELKEQSNVFSQANVDLSDEQATEQFYHNAVEEQGPLWASVHIAGGFDIGSIDTTEKADFMKQINMNLVSCFNSCKQAVSLMRENGGRIVNVTSRPGLNPRQGKGRIAYATAKAGVAALTQSLAAEVVEDDILVNAIAPSVIDTPQNRQSMPDANYDDWPKPKQLAKEILYLISPNNEVTQGSLVTVYGRG